MTQNRVNNTGAGKIASVARAAAAVTGRAVPNPATKEGLLVVAKAGDLNGVKSLFKKGASKTANNIHGVTVLMFAAFSGNKALVQYLVEQEHCSLTDKSNLGLTVLMFATLSGKKALVEYLLSLPYQWDLTVSTIEGNTVYNYASSEIKILLDAYKARQQQVNATGVNNNANAYNQQQGLQVEPKKLVESQEKLAANNASGQDEQSEINSSTAANILTFMSRGKRGSTYDDGDDELLERPANKRKHFSNNP